MRAATRAQRSRVIGSRPRVIAGFGAEHPVGSAVDVSNPFGGRRLSRDMDGWLGIVVLVAVWMIVQVWVLPKLGVPS